MNTYELVFLDEEGDIVETENKYGGIIYKNKIKKVDIGNTVIVLSKIKEWESREQLIEAHDALQRIFYKKVVIINHPTAKDIKFARLKILEKSPPDKKSLYRRKLRLGRKHDIKDKEETDAKISEEKEEIPEEKTSTGVEEDTVGWRWPH